MIQFMRRFYEYFKGMKLKNKLLLSYIVFFFLPLCFFSVITFRSFTDILEKNVVFSVEKNFSQTFSFLSEKFNKVKKTSDLVLTNDDVNNMFIAKNVSLDADNYFTMKKTMDFLGSFEDEDISRIVLFLYEEEDYDISYYFNSVNSIETSKWYNIINSHHLNFLWSPGSYLDRGIPANVKPSSSSLSLIRRFYNPANYLVTLGYYCIYFQSEPIENIVNMGDTVNGSVTFLQNSLGEVIYTSNVKHFDQLYDLFERRTQEEDITALLKTCRSDGQTLLFAQKQFPNSDWHLTTIISYKDVLSQVKLTQERIVLLTVLISIVCFAFAWMMARSLTKRIIHLQTKMKQVQKGNFISEGKNSYTDEIGYLTSTYDYMVSEIKNLMEERYKAGIQVKALELKTLQEQINPHFLYNTLDTINWLAQKGSINEVEMAISSLAEFYRLSLSNGDDEIPIKDELKRITTYFQIQNIRFSGGIHLVIDIDDEIGNYLILKLLLQPFVENSIMHGIMNKPSKEGFIIIEAKIDDGIIIITIQDNGIGMSKAVMDKLNEESYEDKHTGYGIRNVKKRITLNYGPQSRVLFTSSPGVGTTAEISIPVKHSES